MAWQVRHKKAGVFMGVSHGRGHFSNISECCKTLGIYRFTRPDQITAFIEFAGSSHLPEHARYAPEDFVVEEWNFTLHDSFLDEGLVQDCSDFSDWVLSTFPHGLN